MLQYINDNLLFCIGVLIGLSACICGLPLAFWAIGSLHPWRHGILCMTCILAGIIYAMAMVYEPQYSAGILSHVDMEPDGKDKHDRNDVPGILREGRDHIFLDMEGLHGMRSRKW